MSQDPPKMVRFTATAIFSDGSSVTYDLKDPRKHDIIVDEDSVNWGHSDFMKNPIIDTIYRFAIVAGEKYPTLISYYPEEKPDGTVPGESIGPGAKVYPGA